MLIEIEIGFGNNQELESRRAYCHDLELELIDSLVRLAKHRCTYRPSGDHGNGGIPLEKRTSPLPGYETVGMKQYL